MAVFWFGWAKKLKNVFTKKEADTYYLQKELPNQLQIVKGNVDFYKNVVIKQQGYVDNVNTNSNTAIPNKKYVDDQLTTVRTYTDTKFENAIQRAIQIYQSPVGTKYSNIQKINVSLSDRDGVDYLKPLTVSFDRYNGTDYQGTFSFPVLWNQQNPSMYGCYTQMYYSKSSQHMEQGQMIGLRLTNAYIEVSCWNQNDRVSNIRIWGIEVSRV